MLKHPDFNPIAVSFGSMHIYWYGVMYILGFIFAYLVFRSFVKFGRTNITMEQAEDAVFYGAMGLVIGARIGYILFYGMDTFWADPLRVLRIYEGGMSFHGGFIGVCIAGIYFSRKFHIRMGEVVNLVAVAAPMGIFFGRMGNFIGQELWGRPTTVPWGMLFPKDPTGLVRHPSQLYEGFSEGLLIFAITFWYTRKPRPEWSAGALFIMCYGTFRFSLEFFREPDVQIGFDLLGWMTRGQILSLPMAIAGLIVFIWAHARTNPPLTGVRIDKVKAHSQPASQRKKKKKKR